MRLKSDVGEGERARRQSCRFQLVLLVALFSFLCRIGSNLKQTIVPLPAKRSEADLRWQRWGWTLVGALGAVIAAGCSWFLELRPSTVGFDQTHHLPFRLLLATLFFAALLWTAKASGSLADRFWTTWWDPSLPRPDGEIEWGDVLELTVGGEHGDALTRPQVFRRRHFWLLAPMHALGVAAALWAIVVIADRLLKWRLPAFIWAGPGDRSDLVEAVANASGNLTAYLALLAGAISIIFTYHQLRAKVRADNRQAWINKARRLLAQIVADADAGSLSTKAISRRLKLELMLNPREKDHRILIFLLQRLARVQDQEQIEAGRHLRRVVGEELARSPKYHRYQHLLDVLDENDRGTLVSYVVRLSHVLLKREWERVKHTR